MNEKSSTSRMSLDRESLAGEISPHYAMGLEAQRLLQGVSRVEFARTQEIVRRYLPPPLAPPAPPAPPTAILDVGGGPGAYALWLATLGYQVHLVDIMPLHVEQARAASAKQARCPLASCEVGDARQLAHPDASVDAVLMLGPLYHLTERSDRAAAWREAARVLKPGGVIVAAAISRFASTLGGLFEGLARDPEFGQIMKRDLIDGQHRNPSNHPAYFTTAYFHLPEELKSEAEDAGLQHEATLGVEGPAWLLPDFDRQWDDPALHGGQTHHGGQAWREMLLDVLRAIEAQPSILGVSAHMLAIARKKS